MRFLEGINLRNYDNEPADKNVKIWRYMNLAKFLDLLESSSIYLARVDKFDDPFEGASTLANILMRKELCENQEEIEKTEKLYRALPKWIYVSCWHMNESESHAMWKLYGSVDGAIAIRSSYKKLQEIIPDNNNCVMSLVHYVDEQDWFPDDHDELRSRFIFKKPSFEYEKEVRILKLDEDFDRKDLSKQNHKFGYKIQINLSELIDEIYISPLSAEWFIELLQQIMERYHLDIPLVPSALKADVFY